MTKRISQISTISMTTFGALLFGAIACSPPIMLPPVQEPLDSVAWKNCAAEAEARTGRSMIDDITKDSPALMCKGVALSNEKKHEDEAVEMLTESALLDKADYRPYWLSGRVLTRAGRYEEALTHFSRAKKRAPNMEVPVVKLAQMVVEERGDLEAMLFLEKARERDMCTFSCRGMLADQYHKAGRVDDAKKIYKDMIDENPDDPEAYIGLARISNVAREFDKEADYLREAIKSKGYDALDEERQATLYFSEAFALYNAEKYKTAKKRLEKAMRTQSPAEWLLLAGWIELKLGESAMALIQFEKAIKKNDKLAAAHAGAGDAAKALGNLKDARDFYRQATTLDPTNGVDRLKLAAVYIDRKEYDKAETQLDDAIKLGEDKLPPKLLQQVKDALRAAGK
ncbi:MAG: tetratricopeptide repeat protein [Deltaproteobacteria bacterium]|nr:tetratricopeptide repeat protein [Deltaproteobacteria bacterium]